jgi:hypothetical protein
MSIVIHQQPQTITPAYNDSWVLAYSNQYAQTGFKYIIEVTINGKTIRRDIAPRLDGGVLFISPEITIKLNKMFGDNWKSIFQLWFEQKTGLKVARVVAIDDWAKWVVMD